MRRNDVASTSFRRHVPTRFLINQCQIITFLILKYDIIENSRIELRGIVLPVQVGGLLGDQRVCWPLLSNYWGGLAPLAPPLPTPMYLFLFLNNKEADQPILPNQLSLMHKLKRKKQMNHNQYIRQLRNLAATTSN